MRHDEVALLQAQHASWRLLRADNAPLVLSFLGRFFVEDNRGATTASELGSALDDELHALNAADPGHQAYPRPGADDLQEWAATGSGWLRRFYPAGSDEVHYDATPALEKAYAWVVGLRSRSFVGTESRLQMAVELLRQIVRGVEQDPQARLAELARRREEIDAEIAEVEAGELPLLDPTALRDRYQQFSGVVRQPLAVVPGPGVDEVDVAGEGAGGTWCSPRPSMPPEHQSRTALTCQTIAGPPSVETTPGRSPVRRDGVRQLLGIGLGLLVGWGLRPRRPAAPAVHGPLPAGAETLDVPAGARVAWIGRATSGPVLLALGAASIVLMVGLAFTLDPWMLVVAVPLVALLATTAEVRVAVDARGVRVASVLGLRWVAVPLERITSAEVTQVQPLAQFGGYGIRIGQGGTRGFILRAGEALRVHRGGEPDVVVTVPGAAEAAAVVNTLVAAVRPPSP